MIRLSSAAGPSIAVALVITCGCDGPRTNHLAAKPVSRAVTAPDRGLDQPHQWLPQSDAPSDDRVTRSSPALDALQRECEAELRRQSGYPFKFRLTSLNGRTIQNRQFAGRLLIVDIWATWCGPCVGEVPHFIDLQNRYRHAGLQVVGINFEHGASDGENRRSVEAFARAAGINYPLALGDESITSQIEGFRGYPTTLFIDGKGEVRLTLRGARSLNELEIFVKLLIKDPSIRQLEPTEEWDSGDLVSPPRIQTNPFADAPSSGS